MIVSARSRARSGHAAITPCARFAALAEPGASAGAGAPLNGHAADPGAKNGMLAAASAAAPCH
jgi:hypothetical protein